MKWTIPILAILALTLAACTLSSPTANVVLDPDPCAHLNSTDSCYFRLAELNETFTCPLIEGERLRSLCYVEVLKFDPSPSHCDRVLEEDRATCYAELGIALEDLSWCEESDGVSRDYCKNDIANLMNDPQVCDTIESSAWADTCHDHFGRVLSDKVQCFKVAAERLRDSCIHNVSLTTGDVDLCNSILNTDPGDALDRRHTTTHCINEHARVNKDRSICSEHELSFHRNVCIYRIAVLVEDVTICEEISISLIRETCVEKITNPEPSEESESTVDPVETTETSEPEETVEVVTADE